MMADKLSYTDIGSNCLIVTPDGGSIEGTLKYILKYYFSADMKDVKINIAFVEFADTVFSINGNSYAEIKDKDTFM